MTSDVLQIPFVLYLQVICIGTHQTFNKDVGLLGAEVPSRNSTEDHFFLIAQSPVPFFPHMQAHERGFHIYTIPNVLR